MRPEPPGQELSAQHSSSAPDDSAPARPSAGPATLLSRPTSPTALLPRRRDLRGGHPSGPIPVLPEEDWIPGRPEQGPPFLPEDHSLAAPAEPSTTQLPLTRRRLLREELERAEGPDTQPVARSRREALRQEREATPAAEPLPKLSDPAQPRARSGRRPVALLWSKPARRALTLVALVAALALTIPMLDGSVQGAHAAVSGTFALRPGQARSADSGHGFLNGTGAVVFNVPTLPSANGLYLGVDLRAHGDSQAYRARVRVYPDGTMRLGVDKVTGGHEQNLGSVPIPGRVTRGAKLHLQGEVAGTSAVLIAARAWLDGAKVPSWQYSTTDNAAPVLSGSGTVRAWAYLSSRARSLTVGYQGLSAQASNSPPLPVTTPTGPAPSSSTSTTKPSPSSSTSSSTKPSSSSSSSASPSPSSSSSGGSGSPGAGGTGVPAGTALKAHYGDLTVSTAGAVISGLDIHGFVKVEASNVTIKDSIIRGGTATSDRGIVENSDGASNFVLENSTLIAAHPSVYLDGMKGWNYTLRRVDIAGGTVDGAKVYGNNVVIEDSWIHGLVYYSSDPNQGGGPTHNDGIQVLGGSNIVIRDNTVQVAASYNSVMQVTQDHGAVKGLSFSGNVVDGGTCSVKLSNTPGGALGPITVTDNRFGRDTQIKGCAVLRTSSTELSAYGNTWSDNGAAVNPVVYG